MAKKDTESLQEEKKLAKTTRTKGSKKVSKKKNDTLLQEEKSGSDLDSNQESLDSLQAETSSSTANGSGSISLEERRRNEARSFKVTVSFSLYKKLLSQAEEEGISLDDYVGEILTEGCVVRAWEINALNVGNSSFKGPGSSFRPQGGGAGGRPNFRPGKNKKSGSHITYEDIMNDKASFLEYVRRKDKRR